MDFGFSFASQLQSTIFYFQKMLIGVMVLIFFFAILRFALWAVLSFWLGRSAELIASVVTYGLAFLVLASPDTRMAAINFGYGLACSLGLGGGSANFPGFSGIERAIEGTIDDIFRSVFPF
ncbi:hypothetical protein PTH_2493 [Pelotomaculum thermopropionicum SI]|uniref:Uncharacterized protein n=1 Tax=Pelotomaculum thermopropionicum (strain DSM 13744 / JCM 10971 / SI) TaxID=370438 RepID=A5CZA5_PELTS|nr:hypothetical protein PTH_2493 [Pelotomaculum thermopropionicum SI]